MEGLHNLLLQSVEPWDDIICASPAIKSVVQTQRDCQVALIEGRFGATRVPTQQLPVVPLGVNAHDFEHVSVGMVRLRQLCEAKDKIIVVMSRVRLTAVEKGNPAPLFMALEDIAQTTGKDNQFWMVDWANGPEERDLHMNGAAAPCPSVAVHLIDGRDTTVRREIWSGADMFMMSLDNVQETFGLSR